LIHTLQHARNLKKQFIGDNEKGDNKSMTIKNKQNNTNTVTDNTE